MKKIRMLLPTGAVIGMLVVGTAFPAMAAADSDTAKFVRGTTINAVDVSKQTAQQAKGYLEGYFNEHYEIKIQDADGNLEVLKGTDVGYHLNVTGSVDDILKEQNDTGRKTGPGSDQSVAFFVFFFDCGETFQDALLFFRVDSGEKRGLRNFFFVDHSFPFFHLTRAAICTFLFPSSITCGLPFFSSECTAFRIFRWNYNILFVIIVVY